MKLLEFLEAWGSREGGAELSPRGTYRPTRLLVRMWQFVDFRVWPLEKSLGTSNQPTCLTYTLCLFLTQISSRSFVVLPCCYRRWLP